MKKKSLMYFALLLLVSVTMNGCTKAASDGKNVGKTEFRLGPAQGMRFNSVADTPKAHSDEVNEKINENWKRDLILGRGTGLCTEDAK